MIDAHDVPSGAPFTQVPTLGGPAVQTRPSPQQPSTGHPQLSPADRVGAHRVTL